MPDRNSDPATVTEKDHPSAENHRAATRALQRFIVRHNWQALLLAGFSLGAAVALWGLIYLFAYWLTLLAVTVSRSLDAATLLEVNQPGLAGTQFPLWFLGGAVCLLLMAWTARDRVRIEDLREARLYLPWVIVELLVAVPNVTFSIWGNLSALVRMSGQEAASAWRLLERIDEENGGLSLSRLRLEIDDARRLRRVVFALQILGLVGVRERQEGWVLCLQNRDAFALLARGGGRP